MPDPGDGSMTFFYTNQQSARLMFYHDHAFGITRLNVYAGEAAPYIIQDQTEQELIAANKIPAATIPLVIQDKTFVDASKILDTDPTWNWGTTPGTPNTGDLWLPHYDENCSDPAALCAGQPPEIPGTPNPSMGMEAFFDTAIVNGTAFPTLTVDPKAYRFRILNAANDRFWNLQLYKADPATLSADLRTLTEVKMVPAAPGSAGRWSGRGRPRPDDRRPLLHPDRQRGRLPAGADGDPQPADRLEP
jgi:FtsP/CotA-like multicopper oxidase with cupredoxin domain